MAFGILSISYPTLLCIILRYGSHVIRCCFVFVYGLQKIFFAVLRMNLNSRIKFKIICKADNTFSLFTITYYLQIPEVLVKSEE